MNKNFNIKNGTEKVTIEVFGDIGEGWFSEGVTMNNIKDQLNEAKGKPIDLIVSSLGGDVSHALVIHDLLKMHNAPVTSKILGATASSGTIIALGASTVEMSDNSLFLVHNASTGLWGNAQEMREAAEELDIWDNRIVEVYKKKTGKRKTQLLGLMGDEKWIDAKEAKSWGFVDSVFTPEGANNVLNSVERKNLLDKINKKPLKMNAKIGNILTILALETLVFDKEKGTYLQEEQITAIEDAIKAKIGELETVTGNLETMTAERETANTSLEEVQASLETATAKVTEQEEVVVGLQTSTNAFLEAVNGVLDTSFESLDNVTKEGIEAVEALKTEAGKVAALESTINQAKSKGLMNVLSTGEPVLLEKDDPKQTVKNKQVKEVEKTLKKAGLE